MQHYQVTPRLSFTQSLIYECPQATAWVTGNSNYPQISGLVKFYQTPYGGVLVEAEIFGLPNIETQNASDFYAIHIHEFGECNGDFESAGSHYNPKNTMHPQHAGDMPPLLANEGYAFMAFYDKRFTIRDIIGKSVIIHSSDDDFTTQPAGNSGMRIACGEIKSSV